MTNPAYKLAETEPEKITRPELKLVFKKILELEDYQKLTHFIWVKQFKQQIPGTYSVYAMYKDGIAVATNSLCINEWLDAHNLPRRKPLHEQTIKRKLLFNRDDIAKIDNRTDKFEWSPKKPGRIKGQIVNGNLGKDVATQIWELHQDGHTPADISIAIGCTVANIYYHIRKQQKRLDKLAD
jgi:hypothetical protein